MNILVHNMKYIGDTVLSNVSLQHYEDRYFEQYCEAHRESFQEMRETLNLVDSTDEFYQRDRFLSEKEDLFLWLENNEIVASFF